MSNITIGGNPIRTSGSLPNVGENAKAFSLTKVDLSPLTLNDLKGSKVVLNIFPSVDTQVCATSVRKFNEQAAQLANTKVICVSRDLPFAQARFCGAEGIENVMMASDYASGQFGKDYGLEIIDPPFMSLHSRVIVVIDENGKIVYTEQVPEIADEPNYEKALASIK
jgi:thiol peroxidase